jgi:hypothetical protein
MNSEKNDGLIADNVGYKVSLTRVAPGHDESVASQLKHSIIKDSHEPPIALLKLFGRFDICAIYKTKDYLDGPSKFGPISGIRGANKILAFHWLAATESSGLSVENGKGDVWALSFFRFNEALVKRSGARIELMLAEEWHRHIQPIQPGVTLDVLGTTGWAELLLLIRGSKFNQVAKALSSISQQIVTPRGHEPTLLPAKTLSIFGIDFELTKKRNRHVLRTRLKESFKPGTGVFPSFSITCPPSAMNVVNKYCRSHFGKGAEVFGATDFLFQPKGASWGKFIAEILDFRKNLTGKIYSTSANILVAPKALAEAAYKVQPKRPLKMPYPKASCITRWGSTLEHRLRNLYFALSNLLQDPLIGDCFEDLRLFAETRLPLALNIFDSKDEDQRDLLYELVELLAYATEERAHGAFLSLEHLESSLSPTKGGIQRILAAVESIPRTLLARVGKRWNGFVVAGYHNEYFSSHYEILNLPFEYLFKPEQWCGLFHEVGHAAFFDKDFYDMDGLEMSNLISRAVPSAAKDDPEYIKWKELAWEIGADMFDLYFCYGKDLDSFLTNIWPFITQGSGRISSERFRRYFLVYEFWKHLLLPGNSSFGRSVELSADIAEFRKRLKSLNLGAIIESTANEEARLAFSGMADVAEVFYQKFRKIDEPRQLSDELERPKMKRAIQSVLRGQPWLETIDAPDTFILGLKKAPRLSLSAKLAAIVSLWHTEK